MIKMINSLLNIKSIKNNFSSLFQHRKDNAKKKKKEKEEEKENFVAIIWIKTWKIN